MGQDLIVSQQASQYLFYGVYGGVFYVLAECVKRYLEAIGVVLPALIIQLTGLAIQVTLLVTFVILPNGTLEQIGIINTVSRLLIFVLLILYVLVFRTSSYYQRVPKLYYEAMKRVPEYLKYAIPS